MERELWTDDDGELDDDLPLQQAVAPAASAPPVQAPSVAPPIYSLFSDPLLVAKFKDPYFQAPATSQWVPAVQQVLENQIKLIQMVQTLLPGPVAGFTFRRKDMAGESFTIGDTQFIDLTVGAVDKLGKPATETATLTADTSDHTIATAAFVAPGDLRVTSAQQNLGTVQVTVTDGKATGSCSVVVQGGPVAAFNFSGGTPQDIPAATP